MCVLLPQVATEVRREEAIDEGIGGGIERRQTLDEGRNGRHRLGLGDVAVDLQQVEDDVRRPAQDEYCQLQCTHVDERDFHQSLIQISDCFPPESLGQKVVTFAQIVLRPILTEDDDECHLDGFDFSPGNNSTGTGPTAVLVFVQHRSAHPAVSVGTCAPSSGVGPKR